MNYEADLNALHTLEALLRCILADIQQWWAENAVVIGRLAGEPNFTELTEFIRNLAKISSNFFVQLASMSRREERHHAKERIYEIPRSSRSSNNYATVEERGTRSCPMCRLNHNLSACDTFVQLEVPERWEADKRHGVLYPF
ncbi:unnamed protein product [Echinostoma caproni]|uniref:Uncharacterized protein n=1 Tax=Echinostoma caproni TaxID=27848 RepID=A0A183AZG6_9TREM|nr:unnamed protein product [Echinostoma caproni]